MNCTNHRYINYLYGIGNENRVPYMWSRWSVSIPIHECAPFWSVAMAETKYDMHQWTSYIMKVFYTLSWLSSTTICLLFYLYLRSHSNSMFQVELHTQTDTHTHTHLCTHPPTHTHAHTHTQTHIFCVCILYSRNSLWAFNFAISNVLAKSKASTHFWL